jgi:hypothetical protein
VSDIDRSIDGVAKTVVEVLEKKKYSIDYYQRSSFRRRGASRSSSMASNDSPA